MTISINVKYSENIKTLPPKPFSSTERMVKHVNELAGFLSEHERAIFLQVYQCRITERKERLRSTHYEEVSETIHKAVEQGVEFWEIQMDFRPEGVSLYSMERSTDLKEAAVMLIDFNEIKEMTIPGMNNETGQMTSRMYMSEKGKIIPTRIHPGGSIGLYVQKTGDDINYMISGTGKAICDGQEEMLTAGCCHICPKASEHSIINTGEDDLVMLTVVVER